MAKNQLHDDANGANPSPEEIEGLEDAADSGLGEYPIDTLLIRKETRTVHDVVRRIEKGGFVLNPDFQRDFVWPIDKQSKLIESVIMRIPLPVFYLAEDNQGRVIVVDGLQRLSTFRVFLANELKLKLPARKALHGKTFDDLSAKLQNRVEDCNLELYVIDSRVPARAKLDIFERVNSGTVLSRQQMRNCLYTGKATRWVKGQAITKLFLDATGKSLDSKKMRDREFVNRFCGFFLLGADKYTTSDMDDYLARTLETMNQMDDEALDQLATRFQRGLRNNYELFGKHAFRKHQPGQTGRSILNASLWDVMSTGLARYPEDHVNAACERLKDAFYTLLIDSEFNDAITYGPNSTRKVAKRFQMADAMFKEVLGDYEN